MNSRGFLLGEETVKIILAIICIVALVAFIIYAYGTYAQNQDSQNAKASLTHLVNDAEKGNTQEIIYNPSGWLLSSFQSSFLPKACTSNKWTNCLCLCIKPSGSIHQPQNACDTQGFCMQSNFSVSGTASFIITWQTNSIEISNPPVILSINQQNKTISKSQ
jgi:hypothetical protein